jgi:hypothetical protein
MKLVAKVQVFSGIFLDFVSRLPLQVLIYEHHSRSNRRNHGLTLRLAGFCRYVVAEAVKIDSLTDAESESRGTVGKDCDQNHFGSDSVGSLVVKREKRQLCVDKNPLFCRTRVLSARACTMVDHCQLLFEFSVDPFFKAAAISFARIPSSFGNSIRDITCTKTRQVQNFEVLGSLALCVCVCVCMCM